MEIDFKTESDIKAIERLLRTQDGPAVTSLRRQLEVSLGKKPDPPGVADDDRAPLEIAAEQATAEALERLDLNTRH